MVGLGICPGAVVSAQSDYRLRPLDTLNIIVTDQADLTAQYAIDETGRVQLPLIGFVEATGLTASELASEVQRRLSDFFTDPQVHATVERTRRVFVFGGVSSPGMYELTVNMTLIELLAQAGYGGASEAVIIRSQGSVVPAVPPSHDSGQDGGPDAAAGGDGADVIRVNLRELEKDLEAGRLSRNVVLEEGDTVFVPRFDPNRVFVSGQVHEPGAYSVPEGTTVLQALTLAGGPTPDAALNRVRILRVVDGSQKSIDVELDAVVQPRDTILVPERFF